MKIEKSESVAEEQNSAQKSNDIKSRRPFFVLFSLIGLFVILTILVYRLPITNPFARSLTFIIPYPAVVVDGSVITIKTFLLEREALEQYLKTSQTSEIPSDEILQQTILDALINKTAIRKLAGKYGVKIDDELVEQYYKDVVEAELSEDDFAKELSETFGWSKSDFKKRIIESIVLALQMSDFVSNDDALQAKEKERIEKALERLEAGEDFAIVAEETRGEDESFYENDLGYQNIVDLPEQWTSAKDLTVGGISEIVEFDQGFAIFTVTDRIDAAEDSKIHLMAIMVPKKTLEDLVSEYLSQAKVRYFVK
jgi:parvulin-like peptidyl-prolyl isomerase